MLCGKASRKEYFCRIANCIGRNIFNTWNNLYKMLPIVYIVDVEVRSFAIFKSWEDFASPQPMGILPTVFVSWNQFRRRESTCRENACQSSRVKRTYICKFIVEGTKYFPAGGMQSGLLETVEAPHPCTLNGCSHHCTATLWNTRMPAKSSDKITFPLHGIVLFHIG